MGLLRECLRAVREVHGGDTTPPWPDDDELWIRFGDNVANEAARGRRTKTAQAISPLHRGSPEDHQALTSNWRSRASADR
jgi:hypothetical protein